MMQTSPVLDRRSTSRRSTDAEIALAVQLLEDLAGHRNVIDLVPAPRPSFPSHKIRVQVEQNPAWYRALLAGRWSRRGCNVKRSRIVKALQRVRSGLVRANGYEVQVLKFVSNFRRQH